MAQVGRPALRVGRQRRVVLEQQTAPVHTAHAPVAADGRDAARLDAPDVPEKVPLACGGGGEAWVGGVTSLEDSLTSS